MKGATIQEVGLNLVYYILLLVWITIMHPTVGTIIELTRASQNELTGAQNGSP